MTNPPSRNLKTGMRPVQQQVRTFKAGEVLFEEGTTGQELFIIQEGRLGVYKDTADGKVELAVIEKGGIIGEMSLLDNLPRSATVRAVETSKVLIINQAHFQTVMQSVPMWLQSIIQIVVSRLRDANKRVDQAVLRDKERGFTVLLLLLLPGYKKEIDSKLTLDFDLVVSEAFFVCRLRKKEIKRIIAHFEKRGILQVSECGEPSVKHVIIKDLEILRLYDEFLLLRSQKKEFRELSIPDEAIRILSNIAYVAQKTGQDTEDGTVLMKSALLEDLSEKGTDKLDKHLLDLKRRGLINLFPAGNDMRILFCKDSLSRIKKIKEWLPKFEMELT